MANISAGLVKDKRSLWRLGIFSDVFWAILNFIGLFVTTMLSVKAADSYGKQRSSRQSGPGGAGSPGGWGPGSGGGGGGGGGPPATRRIWGLDNVRGLNHYAPAPSCGPCAGGSCG